MNNPETRQVSQAVSQTSQKVILQYQQALEKQQAVIENMEKENIKFSRIIAAISLSVGIIV